MTGRRRKKKCDEVKPVCRRCVRNPSEPCIWQLPESSPPEEITGSCETPSESLTVTLFMENTTKRNRLPSTNTIFSTSSIESVPRSPSNNLAAIEFSGLINHLFLTVINASSLPYIKSDVSLFTHSIPCALDSPPLMHAYAACGAAFLSKHGDPWEQMAMSHYSKAVKSVRDTLRNYQHRIGNEWLLATVNALHIFEVSSPLHIASQDPRI
jgi:hypothetical protein